MKRIILSALAALLFCAAQAMPAYPGLIQAKQPDGRIVSLYLHGDEHHHWASTPDGYTLLRDDLGFWAFAERDAQGFLQPSALRYEGSSAPAIRAGIPARLTGSAPAVTELATQPSASLKGPRRAKNLQITTSFPTKGKRKLLLLLINFNDTETTYTQEDFQHLMNQQNYKGIGSFRDYYLEQSYGQLDIETTVTPWIKVNGNKRFYNTENAHELIIEALRIVADQINIADFDNDGDGILDGLAVFHQGEGQEMTGSSADIWSHSSEIYGYSVGGIVINRYTIQPEIGREGAMSNIGVICHEFCHNLGSPDFYDTDYGASGGEYGGTGVWDIMGGGGWNGNSGDRPAPINMWQKIQLGWVTPQTLTTTTRISDMPSAYSSPKAYCVNTTTPGEYFIIENCQREGQFNSALPGSGMLIYHADETLISQRVLPGTLNALYPQAMYTVCADAGCDPNEYSSSYGDLTKPGAPFPGSGRKTEFSDNTLPSSKSRAGRRSYFSISQIAESGGKVSFQYTALSVPPAPRDFKAEAMRGSVQLTWSAPAANGTYQSPKQYTIYRNNDKIATTSSLSYYDASPSNDGLLNYEIDATYSDGNVSPVATHIIKLPLNNVEGITALREDGTTTNTLRWTLGDRLTRIDLTPGLGEYNILHLSGIDSLDYVQRFSAEDLIVYKGAKITAVNIFPLTYPATSSYEVRVWQTDKNGENPTIVARRTAEEFGASAWTRVGLTEPVTIIKGRTYYIGAHVKSTSKQLELMTDIGPYQNGGCLLKSGDTWEEAQDPQGHWYISAELSYPTPKSVTAITGLDEVVTDPSCQLQFPIGFRIYRDGHEVGTTGNLLFLDTNAPAGAHEYGIAALFRGGSETVPMTYLFDGNTTTGIDEAPAALSAARLHLSAAHTLALTNAWGTAEVFSAAGLLVHQSAVAGQAQLQVSAPGIYMVRLVAADGTVRVWKVLVK